MKFITKLALGAVLVAAVFVWQYDRWDSDGRAMEKLHAQEGINDMSCTESDHAGHRWMTCRYPDQNEHGSLFVWSPDAFSGAWIARNDLAHRVINAAMDRNRNGENLPNVPIAYLSPFADENQEWLQSLPDNPWPHLD